MPDESCFKLAINAFRDEDGFPIGCKCYDCDVESCGALIFKCKEFEPLAGAAIVKMSIQQLNQYISKFTNSKIFETPEAFYTCLDSANTVVYAPKFEKEDKNHLTV